MKELMKEILLTQTAGGGYEKMVKLAFNTYCEYNNYNRKQFEDDFKNMMEPIWKHYYLEGGDTEEWCKTQYIYTEKLEYFFNALYPEKKNLGNKE